MERSGATARIGKWSMSNQSSDDRSGTNRSMPVSIAGFILPCALIPLEYRASVLKSYRAIEKV